MIKYIIEGKRWFDKINGNTYHSVSITNAKTNTLIYCSGVVYGYDEAYKQTAFDFLIKNGLFKKENRHNHELVKKELYFNVADVNKKRHLDIEVQE